MRDLWKKICRFGRNEHRLQMDEDRLALEPLEDRVLLAATLELGGLQTILGGLNLNASNDPTHFQAEMGMDINPTNPLNIAGFSHKIGSNIDVDLYYTMDGGATWNVNTIDGSDDGFNSGFRFDPTIAFDADGNLYVGYGMDPSGGTRRLIVGRSTDGGASFDQFTSVDVGSGLDKWQMATGLDPSTGNQAIYITYVEFAGAIPLWVSGSNDGGTTFTTPTRINDQFPNDSPQFGDPAVGPNGELYISWTDRDDDQLKFDADLDGLWSGGDTFGSDTTILNWNRDLFKTTVPAQPQRGIFNGPVMDVDRSGGANDGNIYIGFSDVASTTAPSASADVFLVRSSDQGATWSSRIVVDDGETTGVNSTEFLPWIDVDQTSGSVTMIYYSSQGDESTGNDDVNARLAHSIDGGSTFVESNLSTSTSNESGGYGGDYLEYIGLAVHDGTAHGLWSFRTGGGTDLEALTAEAAFDSSTHSNKLLVTGDDFGITNDNILLRLSPLNPAYLEVIVNGVLQFAGLAATIDQIEVQSRQGDDHVTVDMTLNNFNVTLRGGPGNDTLIAAAGNDTLFGGTGDDLLDGGDGDDTLTGGTGNDRLEGRSGSDMLFGLDGNDVLFGGADTDLFDGNDTLEGGSGHDLLIDFVGDNILRGGIGNDSLRVFSGANIMFGGDGLDFMYGGPDNDTMFGGPGADFMSGGAGIDTMDGGPGNDAMYGLLGNDIMMGGNGNDLMDGGEGDDDISGDAGNDNLRGGAGGDLILGGVGDDTLNAAAPGVVDNSVDTLDGGDGFDIAIGLLDPNDTLISIEDDQRT